MRFGIVDLGTLSLRFDVFDISGEDAPEVVHRYRSMPRLGEGLFGSGRIGQEAILRVVSDLQAVVRQARAKQVDTLIAVGTSALREAANGAELLALVREKTQIEIRVLSGEDEARLTALGIFSNEPLLKDHAALVDIGGGSTEITFARPGSAEKSLSLDLGALRIREKFLPERDSTTGCYSAESIGDARQYIRNNAEPLAKAAAGRRVEQLVGSSGTIRTLERLKLGDQASPQIITQKAVADLAAALGCTTRAEALAIPGMEENRVDVILPGVLILLEILEVLSAESILVTHFSLRHGVLEEALRAA